MIMGEVRFMISEAAKQVHVESHVLRYWEEELDLKIGRTEMGHRYYTDEDIQLFRCIRKLKDEGMLLRDLKPLISDLMETKRKLAESKTEQKSFEMKTEEKSDAENENAPISDEKQDKPAELSVPQPEVVITPGFEQARGLISEVLTEIVAANNVALEKSICQKVTSDVIREMDFLFQAKERREEEHYRKLDSLIRQQQMNRRESVKTGPMGKLRKIFT